MNSHCFYLVLNMQEKSHFYWYQIWDKNNGENICHWNCFQIPWALSELPVNVARPNQPFYLKTGDSRNGLFLGYSEWDTSSVNCHEVIYYKIRIFWMVRTSIKIVDFVDIGIPDFYFFLTVYNWEKIILLCVSVYYSHYVRYSQYSRHSRYSQYSRYSGFLFFP